MDYKIIYDAITEYENMTPFEIQEQIRPIIKSYSKWYLAGKLNVSESILYQYCKKAYPVNGHRPEFTIYAKIMALGINENPINKRRKPLTDREKSIKEYNHKYYMEVTKKKRAEKQKSN